MEKGAISMATELQWELDTDALEEEEIPTFEHGVICSNVIGELRAYLKGKSLGRVVDSSPEYRFLQSSAKNRQPYRQPYVSFIKQERLPSRFRSYPTIALDLAVEVASPSDKDYDIEAKIIEYQTAKVILVWIIHPVNRRVDVYRLATELRPQIYTGTDELDGENIIPGFKLSVTTIFDYPPDINPEPEIIQ